MAIGATRVHGGIGAEGEINGNTGAELGSSLAFFHVRVKNNVGASVDIRGEAGFAADGQSRDGGLGGAAEKILQTMPSGVIAYNIANAATGNIYVITDGTNVPDASVIQTAVRALGSTVGIGPVDVRGTDVINGTTFTVA
jgi:hypothetical protein